MAEGLSSTLLLLTVHVLSVIHQTYAEDQILCPKWQPFTRTIPSFWFGGPVPEANRSLLNISRYSVAVFSSQGVLAEKQCQALKAINPSAVCLTYRQTAAAWPTAPPFSTAVPDPANSDWFLTANNGSRWLSPRYMWNWRNASLQKWYAGPATDQILSQHPAVDGVFFDDFDGSVCPFESAYSQLPSRYSLVDRLESHKAKMSVFSNVATRLCNAGQFGIFAMAASFSNTSTPAAYQCIVNETTSLSQLGYYSTSSSNFTFARYRVWPRVSQLTTQRCRALMSEMQQEYEAGIELFFYTIVEMDELLSDIPVVAFLLWRAQYSMFGASAGWVDVDWRWQHQYDLKLGLPLAVANISECGNIFSRQYSNGTVSLNCTSLQAKILPARRS